MITLADNASPALRDLGSVPVAAHRTFKFPEWCSKRREDRHLRVRLKAPIKRWLMPRRCTLARSSAFHSPSIRQTTPDPLAQYTWFTIHNRHWSDRIPACVCLHPANDMAEAATGKEEDEEEVKGWLLFVIVSVLSLFVFLNTNSEIECRKNEPRGMLQCPRQ